MYGDLFIHRVTPLYENDKHFYTVTLSDKMPEKLVKKYDSNFDKINAALKDYPEMLAQMYLTPTRNGLIYAEMTSPKRRIQMVKALADQPETIIKIYSHKPNEECPKLIEHLSNSDEIELLKNILKGNSEGEKLLSEIKPKPEDNGYTWFENVSMRLVV